MIFREYVIESTKRINENSEAAELRKHLHDQQMKYAAASKRKDKSAMDFWNKAIKNTEEELKYHDNENFSSTDDDKDDENVVGDFIKKMGPRGKSSEKSIIDMLKKSKFNPDQQANVIGFYGIDGEEYFDENGNWKDKEVKNTKTIVIPKDKAVLRNKKSEEDEDRDANDPIKRIEGLVDIEQKKNVINSIKILAKDFKDEGAENFDIKRYLLMGLSMIPMNSDFYQRWDGMMTIGVNKSFIKNARAIYKDIENEGMDKGQINSYLKHLIDTTI